MSWVVWKFYCILSKFIAYHQSHKRPIKNLKIYFNTSCSSSPIRALKNIRRILDTTSAPWLPAANAFISSATKLIHYDISMIRLFQNTLSKIHKQVNRLFFLCSLLHKLFITVQIFLRRFHCDVVLKSLCFQLPWIVI